MPAKINNCKSRKATNKRKDDEVGTVAQSVNWVVRVNSRKTTIGVERGSTVTTAVRVSRHIR